jgi:SH3-like domain-containing protein
MATVRARRTFIITAPQADLRTSPDPDASVAAYLNNGVTGLLLSCDTSDWCKADTGNIKGYLRREDFWGAFPGEAFH